MKVDIVIPNRMTSSDNTWMRRFKKRTSTCSEVVWCPAIVLALIVSIIPVGCLTITSTWDTICRHIRDIDNLSSLSNGFIRTLPVNTPNINFYSVPINRSVSTFRTERAPDTWCIALRFDILNQIIDITTIAFSTSVVFIRSDMNSGYPMKWCIWTIEEFVIDGFDKSQRFIVLVIQV